MTTTNTILSLFVNTWGNYNENGAAGGEWIHLPMDEDELTAELERIAEAMGDHDPEWAIHYYEWEGAEGRTVSEYESIFELNEYAARLADLTSYELTIYEAACEIWGSDVDIDDLDSYNLYTDITDDYDLGYYWAVDSGCYDLDKMGNLANYFNYEAFGRDIRLESCGGFSSFGWIERT